MKSTKEIDKLPTIDRLPTYLQGGGIEQSPRGRLFTKGRAGNECYSDEIRVKEAVPGGSSVVIRVNPNFFKSDRFYEPDLGDQAALFLGAQDVVVRETSGLGLHDPDFPSTMPSMCKDMVLKCPTQKLERLEDVCPRFKGVKRIAESIIERRKHFQEFKADRQTLALSLKSSKETVPVAVAVEAPLEQPSPSGITDQARGTSFVNRNIRSRSLSHNASAGLEKG